MSTGDQSGRVKKRKANEQAGKGSRVESSPARYVLRSSTSTPVKPPVAEETKESKDLALYTFFERERKRKLRKEQAKKIVESGSVPLNLGRAVKFPPCLLNVCEIPETGKVTTVPSSPSPETGKMTTVPSSKTKLKLFLLCINREFLPHQVRKFDERVHFHDIYSLSVGPNAKIKIPPTIKVANPVARRY